MSADPALESALTKPEPGVTLAAWYKFVRRARLGRERFGVAMALASYADNDGTDLRCGVAGLAVDCEMGYSTARRYIAWFREHQFIELVHHGNPRKGLVDVYRLILGPRAKQMEVTKEEYDALKEELREANRAGQKARRIGHQRSLKVSAETRGEAAGKTTQDDPTDKTSALTQVSAETPDQRSLEARSALTQASGIPPLHTSPAKTYLPTGGAPPPGPRRLDGPPTSVRRNEAKKSIDKGDPLPGEPRTTTSAARGTAPVDQPTEPPAEIDTSESEPRHDRREGRCPHGNNSRRNRQGQPRCPECREEPQQHAQIIPFPLASGGAP